MLMKRRSVFIVGLITAASLLVGSIQPVKAATCNSISSCSALQSLLKQQQKDAQSKYSQNKQQAENLQGVIGDLQSSINYTQEKIANTEEQIAVTENLLQQLSNNIDSSQAKLSSAYGMLYEMSRTSTAELIFQSSINDSLSQAQYVQSIQSQLQKELVSLRSSQQQRETEKADLQAQKSALEADRADLAGQKSRQSYLLGVAQSNASYYQGLSADIQKQIADVERKMSILVSQASWGSDIISAGSVSWYYRQLDYTNVFLGGSPYTVAQYGCLITSYAMVSTFYGHRVTPPDIATYSGNFDGNGYLLRQPPPPTSLSSSSTSPVNWATVNGELDAGRPVIVSIYIPSVGKINSDGSSHFIVLSGRTSGKYLMEDPLGQGRSYAASQVRSMKIIRP
jgi:peptidoglycan hydrolase CwlO-like protein